MAPAETEGESQVSNSERNKLRLEMLVELAKQAFDSFCHNISSVFGVDMKLKLQEVSDESVGILSSRFEGCVAVSCVQAEGALDCTFDFVFDREGLFTLGGIIVTHPEEMIKENLKAGTAEKAQQMRDIFSEAGDMLLGSWDRVFREVIEADSRFEQINTFVGQDWSKPEGMLGLAGDMEVVFVLFEMTIGSYPSFKCGVIFPRVVVSGQIESLPKEAELSEEEGGKVDGDAEGASVGGEESAVGEQVSVEAEKGSDASESEAGEEAKAGVGEGQEEPEEKAQDGEAVEAKGGDEGAEGQEPVVEESGEDRGRVDEDAEGASAEEEESAVAEQGSPEIEEGSDAKENDEREEKEPAAERKGDDAEVKVATATEASESESVSEAIRKMTDSAGELAEEKWPVAAEDAVLNITGEKLAVCAEDIMRRDVIWCSGDDTVQQAIKRMKQGSVEYMMIGKDGVLEGLVSKSDLNGAVSPYLKPELAKWRRPLDEATLQLKLKWIMSSPVQMVRPETSLASMMENMQRFGGRCLPVTDEQGKVQGLVTVFDIFKAVLKTGLNTSGTAEASENVPQSSA